MTSLVEHPLVLKLAERYKHFESVVLGRLINSGDDGLDGVERAIRRLVLAGGMTVALFFGGFLLWAAFAALDSAALATGLVGVESSRKQVQSASGGVIREIKVKNGDRVSTGQVLIVLDETQARASADLLRGQMMALRVLEARLVAERDRLPAMTVPDLSDLALPADEVVSTQKQLFVARKTALDGQLAVLNQRRRQLQQEMRGLQEQKTGEETQLKLIDEEITTVGALVKEGLAVKPRLLALERTRAQIGASRGDHIAQMARTEQAIGQVDLQMQDLVNTQQKEVVAELRDTQVRIADTAERLKAAVDTLNQATITAPNDGVAMGLRVHTAGGVVRPGDLLLELVPEADALIIEAKVRPEDVDVVRVGQPAAVRLSSYSSRTTPVFPGHLTYLAADITIDPQTQVGYFAARVTIETDALAEYPEIRLQAGLPVEVMITTDKRTFFQYLVQPMTRVLSRAFKEN